MERGLKQSTLQGSHCFCPSFFPNPLANTLSFHSHLSFFLRFALNQKQGNASPPLLKESTGVSVFIKYVVLFRIDITYEMVFTNGHQEISQITTISVHIPMMAVRKTLRKYRLVFHSIVQVILWHWELIWRHKETTSYSFQFERMSNTCLIKWNRIQAWQGDQSPSLHINWIEEKNKQGFHCKTRSKCSF